jgi:hypothetical protein
MFKIEHHSARYFNTLCIDPFGFLGTEKGDNASIIIRQTNTALSRYTYPVVFSSLLSHTWPPPKSVAIAPGATTFATLPREPNSFARYLVITLTTPFMEAYAEEPKKANRASSVETLMIRPPSFINGNAFYVRKYTSLR